MTHKNWTIATLIFAVLVMGYLANVRPLAMIGLIVSYVAVRALHMLWSAYDYRVCSRCERWRHGTFKWGDGSTVCIRCADMAVARRQRTEAGA